jgi:two-component system chemotaxis response regulator CheB
MVRIVLAASRVELRDRIEKALKTDGQCQIVGTAANGAEAVRLAQELRPDIALIGLRLQKLDGLDTTREIMVEVPTPIVMVADPWDADTEKLPMHALAAGALAVIPAPDDSENDSAGKFLSTVKAMSQVKVVRRWRDRPEPAARSQNGMRRASATAGAVAIAASTGGPGAIQAILSELPADFAAPILVVQHISGGFIEGVAAWLDASVQLRVKMASNGERLRPGTVYLAPDGHHLGVSNRSRILVTDADPVKGFRPSASFLFGSVAAAFGNQAVGVILTGMGDDGTEGLRTLHDAGGTVLAQDEKSSIVFGMPKAAIDAGVADAVLPLPTIAREIVALATGTKTGT